MPAILLALPPVMTAGATMGLRFNSIGVLLLSLLMLAGAAAPAVAQSPTGKLEQLVRAKGKPFKINPVSAGYLGLGKAEVPVIQHPLTDSAGNWHAANLTASNTIVLMFMPASKKYAIYWRLTASGEIARTVYGTIGQGATQSDVPNSRYVKQFRSEMEFWSGEMP
jgi:hypothetical protein